MTCASIPRPSSNSCSELRADVSVSGERLCARLAGDLRVASVGLLDRILMRITVERPQRVVLDLSDVHSIPCLAIGSVAAFYRGILRRGGSLQVVAPDGAVRSALERTWLGAVLAD